MTDPVLDITMYTNCCHIIVLNIKIDIGILCRVV